MHAAFRRTAACLATVAALVLPAVGSPSVSALPAAENRAQVVPGAGARGDDELGRWQVSLDDSGTPTLTWRSPRPLPFADARPEFRVDGRLLGAPQLSADRRTLSLTVEPTEVPDPAEVDVVLSGTVLDHREQPAPKAGATPYVEPGTGTTLVTDPGRPGPHAVVTSDYRLEPTTIRGFPAKVEMVGHVVRPEDSTRRAPLVVFLHGQHNPCFGRPTGPVRRFWPCPDGMRPVPSHLGYDYAQRLLARQGYVTVSISANGINAQDYRHDDAGAGARATLVRRHLATWAEWADAGRYDVSMREVVLVGHSRGGEGVNRAALTTEPTAPYRFAGQVLLAPTNFGRQVASYLPTVTLLPYCDGDVYDLQGQSYTDIARDITTDDRALRSSVLVMGANHNYFNTEWTPSTSVGPSFDDWGHGSPDSVCGRRHASRLSAAEQRAVGKTYIAGAVRLLVHRDVGLLPMFDGSNVEIPSAGDVDVRTHAIGGRRELRRPGMDVALGPASGAATMLCVGRSGSARPTACGRQVSAVRTPHWIPDSPDTRGVPMPRALEMRWDEAGASGGLTFRQPLDLSSADRLDLRTAVDPALGGVRLKVRLHDEAGRSTLLTPADAGRLPALPGADPLGKAWAQTLRVPLAGVGGVDLDAVTRLDIIGASADGRVWVLDVGAVEPGLPRVRPRGLARVTLHDVRVLEGDGPGEATLRVPYSISGRIREPARFVVLALNQATWKMLPPTTVDLAPRQSEGTFELTYTPDSRDDLPVPISLTAFAVRDVMTARYRATARIIDDDPAPRVRVHRVTSPVAEGRSARWRVTLSEPVGYHAQVVGRVVAAPVSAPRVRVGDVTAQWREHYVYPRRPLSTPLHQTGAAMYGLVPLGRTTTTLAIPMRGDRVREGREAVSLRVRLPRLSEPVVRTVYVTD